MEIEKALKILLTPDGKGANVKAETISELCQTVNPNILREVIEKFLKRKENVQTQ